MCLKGQRRSSLFLQSVKLAEITLCRAFHDFLRLPFCHIHYIYMRRFVENARFRRFHVKKHANLSGDYLKNDIITFFVSFF